MECAGRDGCSLRRAVWIANPVIAQWISTAYETCSSTVRDLFGNTTFARVCMWIVALCFSYALLRGRRRALHTGDAARVLNRADDHDALLTRSLVLFNIVFAVQTILDLYYLGTGAALPGGMTFATYAHRGAYPLITAALLAGAFTLWAFPAGRDGGIWSRRLVAIWIAQCVLLTFSAAWRLWLYVDEYSLTRWRLATILWLAIVSFGLASLIVRIMLRRDGRSLITWNVRTTLAVLALCTLPNFDGFIARYIVAHCREMGATGQPLDIKYLQSLGPASMPALATFAEEAPPEAQAAASGAHRSLAMELDRTLSTWRGWSVRRVLWEKAEAPRLSSQHDDAIRPSFGRCCAPAARGAAIVRADEIGCALHRHGVGPSTADLCARRSVLQRGPRTALAGPSQWLGDPSPWRRHEQRSRLDGARRGHRRGNSNAAHDHRREPCGRAHHQSGTGSARLCGASLEHDTDR